GDERDNTPTASHFQADMIEAPGVFESARAADALRVPARSARSQARPATRSRFTAETLPRAGNPSHSLDARPRRSLRARQRAKYCFKFRLGPRFSSAWLEPDCEVARLRVVLRVGPSAAVLPIFTHRVDHGLAVDHGELHCLPIEGIQRGGLHPRLGVRIL